MKIGDKIKFWGTKDIVKKVHYEFVDTCSYKNIPINECKLVVPKPNKEIIKILNQSIELVEKMIELKKLSTPEYKKGCSIDEQQTKINNDRKVIISVNPKGFDFDWIKAVEEAAQNLVQTDELEGFKLVAGRNSRKWKFSDEDIVKLLVDDFDLDLEQVVTSETISVAQCEKLLDKDGKKELKDYYISISGKAQIVPVDDKRPALTTSLDDFDTLE